MAHARETHGLSERRARLVVKQPRGTQRYRPTQRDDEDELTHIPVWDAHTLFGDINLLISDLAMGRDFARVLAGNNSALMRGHGCSVVGRSIREAVYTAVYLEVNAGLQMQASRFSPITFLSDGEIKIISERFAGAKPNEGMTVRGSIGVATQASSTASESRIPSELNERNYVFLKPSHMAQNLRSFVRSKPASFLQALLVYRFSGGCSEPVAITACCTAVPLILLGPLLGGMTSHVVRRHLVIATQGVELAPVPRLAPGTRITGPFPGLPAEAL